ncbi:MAG TPA: DoxX family membrane protein [Dehalococcoidia bacterium]|nr:DoxX family membrane protein [Dehalococcoidia bacterium]
MIARAFARRQLQDPAWFTFFFGNVITAPVWAVARIYIGWQWLQAGWHKVDGNGWLNQDGAALQSFWQRIVAVPEQGQPAIKYDWYREFIQYMLDHEWYTWFAWIVALGETVIGVALIVGAFTGLAALAGATMNFNFLLAGSASTNPVLFLIAILLILSWKVSGFIGVDRWLLPALGTPWEPGGVFRPSVLKQTGQT